MDDTVWTVEEVQEHPMSRSLSDNDICSECRFCAYVPGENSLCKLQVDDPDSEFPGLTDEDGEVFDCDAFEQIDEDRENWVGDNYDL